MPYVNHLASYSLIISCVSLFKSLRLGNGIKIERGACCNLILSCLSFITSLTFDSICFSHFFLIFYSYFSILSTYSYHGSSRKNPPYFPIMMWFNPPSLQIFVIKRAFNFILLSLFTTIKFTSISGLLLCCACTFLKLAEKLYLLYSYLFR